MLDASESVEKYLNERQKAFCRYLVLEDMGQAEAYEAAYGSSKSASSNASRLVKIGKVQRYIKYLRSTLENRSGVDKQRIMKELSAIAFSRFDDYLSVNSKGEIQLKESSKWKNPEAVKKISREPDGKLNIELHNKQQSLDSLARIAGLFMDINQAILVLGNYGYKVVAVDGGYLIIDSFSDRGDPNKMVESLQEQEYELLPNGDGTYEAAPVEPSEEEAEGEDDLEKDLFG